ncbi:MULTISPECIES: hypothetical protein [Streptomyces]|uniref:hypothetical protein n=1 Tax=Streptomyces TaxID=1883 RepID=UPI001180B8AF|nr:hypothetical protein [Streptomyces kasugaensis]
MRKPENKRSRKHLAEAAAIHTRPSKVTDRGVTRGASDHKEIKGSTLSLQSQARASMPSVTLRNTSGDPVLVTDAGFQFSSAEELTCTSGAGGAQLRAQYNIKVPIQHSKSFTVKRKMKYTVPPHRQERVAFSVDPEYEWEGQLPYIYTFTVVLHADNEVRLDVPESTVIITPDGLKAYLENARTATEGSGITDPGCIRKEAKAVQKVVAEAKRPSPELREFSAELTRIAQRL